MKTKIFFFILVVLFTSSLYAQGGYRIEKVGNDTVVSKVGELIAEIPYFDSLPILVEEYGIDKVAQAWVNGKSEIDVSPLTKENRWLPLSQNQKKTVFLCKKENKIVSETKTYPPITLFSRVQVLFLFLLCILGAILDFLISKYKEKKERKSVIILLSLLVVILLLVAVSFSVFPLIGVPIGFLITRLLKKNQKIFQEKPPE